jgi:hypothetical protein
LRKANVNAEARGDASERVWNDLLQGHVPHRDQVSKGFVTDADGAESHFIDVIIYDRQDRARNRLQRVLEDPENEPATVSRRGLVIL